MKPIIGILLSWVGVAVFLLALRAFRWWECDGTTRVTPDPIVDFFHPSVLSGDESSISRLPLSMRNGPRYACGLRLP